MTNLEKFLAKSKELREALASIEHDQWRTWARHLLYHTNGEPNLTEKRKKRWSELINTEYEDLPEEWKEHDRVWADQILEILNPEIKDEMIRVMAEALEEFRLGHEHAPDLKHTRAMGGTYGWCDYCQTKVSWNPGIAEAALARVEELSK